MKFISIALSQVFLAAPAYSMFKGDSGPATTVFGPSSDTSGVGAAPGDDVLGPVFADSDFDFDGEILFFQNGAYYVGGAGPASGNPLSPEGLANLGAPVGSNRAFGYAGAGCATIDISAFAVDSVVIQARGTSSADSVGPTAGGTTFPNSTPLADADVTLRVSSSFLGFRLFFLPGRSVRVSNDGYGTYRFDAPFLGLLTSITEVELCNGAGGQSAAVMGEFTVNT